MHLLLEQEPLQLSFRRSKRAIDRPPYVLQILITVTFRVFLLVMVLPNRTLITPLVVRAWNLSTTTTRQSRRFLHHGGIIANKANRENKNSGSNRSEQKCSPTTCILHRGSCTSVSPSSARGLSLSLTVAAERTTDHAGGRLQRHSRQRRAGTTATTTTTALFSTWQIGDGVTVVLPISKDASSHKAATTTVPGTVLEAKRGWYTVQVGAELVKCRGTQLTRATVDAPSNTGETVTTATTKTSNASSEVKQTSPTKTVAAYPFPQITTSRDKPELPILAPPPPTINDLDALLRQKDYDPSVVRNSEYLEQVAYFSTFEQWVVFTDLHCSPGTLDTCLQVLDVVHAEAVERRAGIVFLGDWWHVRGSLRVDNLNAVLDALKHWTQPMLLIPGNHDQVTAAITDNHSLTPLQHAYRVPVPSQHSHDGDFSADAFSVQRLQVVPTTTKTGKTLPGLLILSHPTVFANALWIPHIRSPAVLESVLQSEAAVDARAIFCHADVTGAYMNDNIVSLGGVPPRVFPPNIPIYAGHFHKPHTVTRMTYNGETGQKEVRCIEYLGSPYEVSLSEAQQPKSLAVLDASRGWTCVDRIALNVGRKHFRPPTLADFLTLRVVTPGTTGVPLSPPLETEHGRLETFVSAGDRVVLTMDKHALDDMRQRPVHISLEKSSSYRNGKSSTNNNSSSLPVSELDEHVARLRKAGVMVEIREAKDLSETSKSAVGGAELTMIRKEDMSTTSLWSAFLALEVERGSMAATTKAVLQQFGMQVLEELEDAGGEAVNGEGAEVAQARTLRNATGTTKGTEFELHSISVKGFGPFRDEFTYPLLDRGLVLLRGSNKDGGSDSNGSGKTSLAMSMLWALTGSVDPRPFQDAKVSDVVNDASKAAVVTVKGALNGIDFSISRTKTSTKGWLVFLYDGRDLTTQSVKETQDLINEKLGISPQVLARTMFHGQHALNELLESTDTKLKDELSLVVPLSIWQGAVTHTRKRAREASKRASEFEGMLSVRSEDMTKLQRRLEEAEAAIASKEAAFEKSRARLHEEIDSIVIAIGSHRDLSSLADLEDQASHAGNTITEIELERQLLMASRDAEMGALEQELDDLDSKLALHEIELRSVEQELIDKLLKYGLAKERVADFEEMWMLDLSSGMPESFVVPGNCPTCRQPISGDDSGGSHETLEFTIKRDIEASLARLSDAQSTLEESNEAVQLKTSYRRQAEERVTTARQCILEKRAFWSTALNEIESRLGNVRAHQQSMSANFAAKAKQLEGESRIQSLEARITAESENLEVARSSVEAARNDLADCELRVLEIESEKMEQSSIAKVMADLSDAFGQRGIQTFVMQTAVSMLESSAQAYLDQLSEGAQRLELTLDSGDRIARRAFVRGGDGVYKERALASLSGGQWRRCSLALNLSFASLVASRANFRPSVCVMDEPLTHLDHSGRADVGRVVRGLLRRTSENGEADRSTGFQVSTILIILQDLAAQELEESFDCIDDVVMENGLSTLRMEGEGLL